MASTRKRALPTTQVKHVQLDTVLCLLSAFRAVQMSTGVVEYQNKVEAVSPVLALGILTAQLGPLGRVLSPCHHGCRSLNSHQ